MEIHEKLSNVVGRGRFEKYTYDKTLDFLLYSVQEYNIRIFVLFSLIICTLRHQYFTGF